MASAMLAAAFATCAQANETHRWPIAGHGLIAYEATIINGDPWADGTSSPPIPEDAYVFADVTPGLALSQDAVAAAVRFDVERLSRVTNRPLIGAGRAPNAPGRVASVFDRFVQVGLTYASVEVARGRGGPASLAVQPALEPAVLAMSLPERVSSER